MEPSDVDALILGPAVRALTPVPDAPRLSAASAAPLREITAVDERGAARMMHLAIERPLTILADGREIVTLMTLGAAPEWLVLGYLNNQRLIDDVTAVRSVEVDWTRGVASVISRQGNLRRPSGAAEQGSGAASLLACGLGTVFGDAMRRSDAREAVTAAAISHTAILAILESMRGHDAIHRAAGSVHSCALFRGGELWAAVEEVSRHNGVDTITGFMRLHGVDGADKILFTTGRLTAEMVMKAAHNGIPVMISRNGTTAMGYELAAKLGMTLIGRAANRRYLCYIGADRIVRDADGGSDAPHAADGGTHAKFPLD
jgi:FdhD protein